MADVFTWVLSEIRAEFRELTGRKTTDQLSNADSNKHINDYYTNYMPSAIDDDLLRSFLVQAVTAVDSGEYTLAQTVLKLEDPVTLNGEDTEFYSDKELFFLAYPEDEQYITEPGLAIGSSDVKKVKNNAFSYAIAGNSYSKASAETAFSGLDTVPQNKFGAFSLTLDADGTITINQAGANSTGYASPALAIAALPVASADSSYMGYVTVFSTDAGGFVPGTTDLNDAAVTDTYTDGQVANRNTPEAILQYEGKLWARPKAKDTGQLKIAYRKRPDALDGDSSAPLDVKWGPLIALGAAILFLLGKGETERAEELAGQPVSLTDFRLTAVANKSKIQSQRRFNKVSF